MILVDGHLDLAFNECCFGRDPRLSALAIREGEAERPAQKWRGTCMVGLPELRAGRVAVVLATIFAPRRSDWEDSGLDLSLSYASPGEAEVLGLAQLRFYADLASAPESGFALVRSPAELREVLAGWEAGAVGRVGLVMLMEGADPIRVPQDAAMWRERGVRIVGLAWRGTRYAGGTGEPGGLTADGRALLRELREQSCVLDLSHASEESFFEALEIFDGAVIASHSNPRALCPGDRQVSDEMIRRIAERGGVIGTVPFNGMLVEGWAGAGKPRVPLRRVAEAIRHVAEVSGTHEAAGIGSDADGGFGAESTPAGLDTVADLPRIGEELADLGFTDEQIYDILGRNWVRFLEKHLPAE